MSPNAPGEVTNLLSQWQEPGARERLFAIIYPELRRVAELRMRSERADHTLQPTALVNEVFLHLVQNDHIHWKNRAHFLAISSEAMRRILVDCARAHRSQKRGSGAPRVPLEDDHAAGSYHLDEILLIDRLLDQLAAHDPRVARVVELRYFGGLTFDELAEVLDINVRTAKRDWQIARAWLYNSMSRETTHGSGPLEPN